MVSETVRIHFVNPRLFRNLIMLIHHMVKFLKSPALAKCTPVAQSTILDIF